MSTPHPTSAGSKLVQNGDSALPALEAAGLTGAHTNGSLYSVREEPAFKERPFRVVCIGAGLSGIYLAIQAQMVAQGIDLQIYEKNAGVGGTWFETKYPGSACDVPAHRYCYTFEPNPKWSTFYAPAQEIGAYLAHVADKYDVMKYIKLEHKVCGASWIEETGKWKLRVSDVHGNMLEDECDVLINGMGVLNNWKWPAIKGLHSFKGTLLHSAAYDTSVDLTGKSVAVIGSGSSGIQIVPNIQPIAKSVGAYLRSSTWIVPPFGSQYIKKDESGNPVYEYSEAERQAFEQDPETLLDYRRTLEKDISQRFRMYMKDHPSQAAVRPVLIDYMKGRLAKKPELADHLIPKWPVGCRRLTPGIGFLEALCEDNVNPVFSDIAEITEHGVTTIDGRHDDYDVIICATGFDVSYGARFPFEGRNGVKLDGAYHNEPTSYMAIGTPGFPNYFTFNGPNAPVGAGSLVPAVEAQGDYMLKAIVKMQKERIRSMVPNQAAVDDFMTHKDTWMPRTVWSTGCRSWYKNGKVDGKVTALWPGSGLHFIDSLSEPRWEDYDYTYMDPVNRFSFLGDGFTQLEWDDADRTHDLEARTNRMLSHPALSKGKVKKAGKVFRGVDAVNGVLGQKA